jgi:acylphosphatase
MAEPLIEGAALILDPFQRAGVEEGAIRYCALSEDGTTALLVASQLKYADLRSGEIYIAGENPGVLGIAPAPFYGVTLMWNARNLYRWSHHSQSSQVMLAGSYDHRMYSASMLFNGGMAFARREGRLSYLHLIPNPEESFPESRDDDTLWIQEVHPLCFACGLSSGIVELWRFSESSRRPTRHVLDGHAGPVVLGRASLDRRHLVTASTDLTIRLWTIDEAPVPGGISVAVLTGHGDEITDIAVTPDGRRVISASRDRTIRLWSVPDGQPIKTLTDHQDWVTRLAINRDGKRMASCSEDGTIKLWDLEKLECIATAYGVSRFLCLAMSSELVCAGDASGNFWMLQYGAGAAAQTARSEPLARRYFVIGRVQGVGYRSFAQNTAGGLGIRGYVRNLPDGRIEIYAIGSEQQLTDLKKALATGPPGARTERVDEEAAPLTEHTGFTVLP